MLYQMLTGSVPFQEESAVDLMMAAVTAAIPRHSATGRRGRGARRAGGGRPAAVLPRGRAAVSILAGAAGRQPPSANGSKQS